MSRRAHQRPWQAASTGFQKPMNELITVDQDEAARITGRDKSTLSELHRSGTGPIACQSPFDGQRRYRITDLHRWLRAQEVSQ